MVDVRVLGNNKTETIYVLVWTFVGRLRILINQVWDVGLWQYE